METIYDAARGCVDALGGPKEVGQRLRPEKSMEDARVWLLACLNPDRNEKLDPEQLVWLFREARAIGHHASMHWLCDCVGYSHPVPITQEQETAELQRQFIAAVDRQERLFAQMRAAGVNMEGVA